MWRKWDDIHTTFLITNKYFGSIETYCSCNLTLYHPINEIKSSKSRLRSKNNQIMTYKQDLKEILGLVTDLLLLILLLLLSLLLLLLLSSSSLQSYVKYFLWFYSKCVFVRSSNCRPVYIISLKIFYNGKHVGEEKEWLWESTAI